MTDIATVFATQDFEAAAIAEKLSPAMREAIANARDNGDLTCAGGTRNALVRRDLAAEGTLTDLGWRVRVVLGGTARPAPTQAEAEAPYTPASNVHPVTKLPHVPVLGTELDLSWKPGAEALGDFLDEILTAKPNADGSVSTNAGDPDAPWNQTPNPRGVLDLLTRRGKRALRNGVTKSAARTAHPELCAHGLLTQDKGRSTLTRMGAAVVALIKGTATAY